MDESLPHLSIQGPAGQRTVQLDPEGVTIGRSAKCDIVLDDPHLSRTHARVFRDPFERWILEDVGSRNGIWIKDEKVERLALAHQQRVILGDYMLTMLLSVAPDNLVEQTLDSDGPTSTWVDENQGNTVYGSADQSLSSKRLSDLNQAVDALAMAETQEQLYEQACRSIVTTEGGMAVVVQLNLPAAEPLTSPRILASWPQTNQGEPILGSEQPLSKRVLEAIRNQELPVMAGDLPMQENQMELTLVDTTGERVVYCARISHTQESLDVIYLQADPTAAREDMLDYVRAIAHQVRFTDRSLQLGEARAEQQKIEQQLHMARDIQMRLTPKPPADVSGVELGLVYKPALWVGGDFCDTWVLPDGQLAFVLGDVVGKGLPAAMVMASMHASLRTMLPFQIDLAETANHLSRYVQAHFATGTFASLVLGSFNPQTGVLQYVNAGHVLPMLRDAAGTVQELGQPMNPPVGLVDIPYTMDTALLQEGQGIVIVTDGVTETCAPGEEIIDVPGFQDAVERAPMDSAQSLAEGVDAIIEEIRQGLPPHDDTTIFTLIRRSQ
jgi:serine phosphatase RsbU (regulator of sigma subunit)